MKSVKKLSLAALIAIFAVSLLLLVSLNLSSVHTASAADQTTNIDFQIKINEDGVLKDAEKDENGNILLVRGQTFKLISTFTSTYPEVYDNVYWYAVNVFLGIFETETGNTYYGGLDNYITVSNSKVVFSDGENEQSASDIGYETPVGSFFSGGQMILGLGTGTSQSFTMVSAELSCVFEVDFTIEDEMPENNIFYLGIRSSTRNAVGYSDSATGSDSITDTNTQIGGNRLPVKIRELSKDATLKELEVGHPGTEKVFSTADDADNKISATAGEMTYSSDNKDLTTFTVKPTANDKYVKSIEVSLTDFTTATVDDEDTDADTGADGGDDETTESAVKTVASGESTTLTLQAGANTLYVRVTAEDGSQLTYTVSITMAYVRLSDLTSKAETPTEGVTKNGLNEDFDGDTYEYTVSVPDDFTELKISATVLAGYDAKTDIAVTATNCNSDSTLTSTGSIEVSDFTDGADEYTLELKVIASDGTSYKTYKLTFVFVSVKTDITLKVTGSSSNEEISNDGDSATAESADYYYSLKNETEGKAKLEMVSAGEHKVSITVDSVEYVGETEYGVGIYAVEVTAEAGNTKTYKVVFARSVYLKLAADATCDFIAEYEFDDDGEWLYYRRTYEYLGWTHGYDDAELDTVVLGQILPNTSINNLLSWIDESQRTQIKLYTVDNDIVYDCGEIIEDVADEYGDEYLDDGGELPVGTGWYIVFNEETVYISVLGDIDGDGQLATLDSSNINTYLVKRQTMVEKFKNSVCIRLAAYITNGGDISTLDSSAINTVLIRRAQMERYLAMPDREDED